MKCYQPRARPERGLEGTRRQHSKQPPAAGAPPQHPQYHLQPQVKSPPNTPPWQRHGLDTYQATESFQKEPVRLRSWTPKVREVRSSQRPPYATEKFCAQNRIRGAVSL